MEYVIGDEVQIEYSIQLAHKVQTDFAVELPIVTIGSKINSDILTDEQLQRIANCATMAEAAELIIAIANQEIKE